MTNLKVGTKAYLVAFPKFQSTYLTLNEKYEILNCIVTRDSTRYTIWDDQGIRILVDADCLSPVDYHN